MEISKKKGVIIVLLSLLGLLFIPEVALANVSTVKTLGAIATHLTASFSGIAKLITGASYLAGIAFAVGAIMKFKQHKDNPTQIPIGTPIALLFISAALMFLPTVYQSAGVSVFGKGAQYGSLKGTTL